MSIYFKNIYWLFCRVFIRPYLQAELTGWGRVYSFFVGSYERDWLWSGSDPAHVSGKLHDFIIRTDIQRWSERFTYFLGRFYDLPLQVLMMKTVREGDIFVDIGTNRGEISLLASHLVGASGKVIAFEPNPMMQAAFLDTISNNGIKNIELHKTGLSDQAGTQVLKVPHVNSGEATFGKSQYDPSEFREVDATISVADNLLEAFVPIFIKIDVEGYEYKVLRGLRKTVERAHPLIATELIESHLKRSGSSVDEIFDLMTGYGYLAYEYSCGRRGKDFSLLRREAGDPRDYTNLIWVHPGSAGRSRIEESAYAKN